MTWVAVALIGMLVGFTAGAFGKGGAAIASPLLHAVGVPALLAVTAPLPATIPSTALAAREYRSAGLWDLRLVRRSIAIGAPATAAGAYLSRWVDGRWLITATDVLIVLLGVHILAVSSKRGGRQDQPRTGIVSVSLVAAGVGALSGLLANSGGFLLAPLYVTVLRRPVKAAFAASLLVSGALAIPGTVVHAALGQVSWSIVAVFAAASVPFAQLGARLAVRSSPAALERVYAVGLILIGSLTALIL